LATNPLIKTEFGIQFVMGTGFDMSAQTGLQFTFLKPDASTKITVPGTLGTTELVTSAGTFAANTWASYIFADGDLDQAGIWKAELRFQDGSPSQLFSTIAEFEVVEGL